jgi:hypothetical protein
MPVIEAPEPVEAASCGTGGCATPADEQAPDEPACCTPSTNATIAA